MNKTQKYSEPLHIPIPFAEALNRFSKVNPRELQPEVTEEGKTALPFVKWAGGKRSIIKEITSLLPKVYNNYYEPFAGGGALYFEVHKNLKNAYLSDVNFDLILTYKVIQTDVTKLIELLKKHESKHSEDYYTKIRSQHTLQNPIEIAGRFIYLNKTCFNGLYRVNKKGEFNVPIGKYEKANVVTEKNLIACSKALKVATIEYKDYLHIEPQKNDFVYFDPPYHPTNDTSFTSYTKADFTEKDQSNLRDFILKLHKTGVKVMLSNSNTKFINDLYSSKIFKTTIVNVPRYINCKPQGRNHVEEVIITNY